MPSLSNKPAEFAGYRPGFIGRIVEVHALYYHQHWGFDASFESQVARELGEFIDRYDAGRDLFRIALNGAAFAGSVVVDGGLEQGAARLRWFIVDPAVCGRGVGWSLLTRAAKFARQNGYGELYLWTFAGLEAARTLYERAGFVLAEEHPIAKWGTSIKEQKYVLRF